MAERPYVLLSAATSIDGYLDDATGQRLMLSNEADFDRVDAVRAEYDAILVGANTIRQDNPRLLVRSPDRRGARCARSLPASPVKVTLTGCGDLDETAHFFTSGDGEKLVYCASPAWDKTHERVGAVSTVIAAGDPIDLERVVDDLATRGIRRLMVEGGGTVHTQFLAADLADELQLVIAPLLVGDSRAPRFVGDGAFPWHRGRRAGLAEVRQLGDVVLLRYALSDRFSREVTRDDSPAR